MHEDFRCHILEYNNIIDLDFLHRVFSLKTLENLEFSGDFFLSLKMKNFHEILSVLREIYGILFFNLNSVFLETFCLIISSCQCKMSTIGYSNKYNICMYSCIFS